VSLNRLQLAFKSKLIKIKVYRDDLAQNLTQEYRHMGLLHRFFGIKSKLFYFSLFFLLGSLGQ
jgi:hypothetical protein